MQEELLVCCICVGFFFNSGNPFEEASENNFYPSVISMSLDHYEEDLALKSPVITDKNGLRLFISLNSLSKLDKNKSYSLIFSLGERYNILFIVVSHL